MAKELSGGRVLAITSNYGVEQDELMVPVTQLTEHGAGADIAGVSSEPIVTLVNDKNRGITVTPQMALDHANTADYDVLLIPGGTLNADTLRQNTDAVNLVSAFHHSGRLVAAICHGPWLLLEADVVKDRTLTSYPSLRTDIRNAGGNWVDEPVVHDDSGGQMLITSRTPNDLSRFVDAIRRGMAANA